jgi:hypothetical protein
MSYCEHCEGQRFDRARVLRALRELRRQVRASDSRECSDVLDMALQAVLVIDIPHMEIIDTGSDIIH